MRKRSSGAFSLVFVVGILVQLYFLGIPLGQPDPNPTLETMFNPLLDTLTGYIVYIVRAAIPALMIAMAVKFWR
ncbi:MAG: hypothetical protein Q4C89_00805 [Deinococcus sp.]|uniref:hypothetical protein n=1 Tax=Deinococcus sp. TaxID=47478 RepID=UPI0026DBD345|nr:hypothetical protein [Deinococcus sp.]MDO4244548.1 hypothetical protein [Deinococcus sp.]